MKRPRKCSTFSSAAAELNYLNEWIGYYWSQRSDPTKALQFCDRFEELLMPHGRDDGSIALQEHWGLLCQVKGDTKQAIWHGKKEIALAKRALQIGGPIGPIDYKHLARRLVRLGELYEINGDNDKAIQAFGEAETLAAL